MATQPPKKYAKVFVPIESNPDVFLSLTRALGVPPPLTFIDIFSLDPDVQPLPARLYALILVFPTTTTYEARKKLEDDSYSPPPLLQATQKPPATWFPQTINNACGTYALIHALANGAARALVPNTSVLGKLLVEVESGARSGREVLEGSDELERAHASAAEDGDTAAPELGAEVDFHYVAFVRSNKSLWELDGDRKGPVVRRAEGGEKGEGFLDEGDVEFVRAFVEGISEDGDVGFALMGLVDEE